MAENRIPQPSAQLIGLCNKVAPALVKYGVVLQITQVPAAGFQSVLTTFEQKNGVFDMERSARLAVSRNYQAKLEEIAAWLGVVKGVLTPRFGIRWNVQWAQAGFTNGSTAIPQNNVALTALALSLASYFTANPGAEVAGLNVTAAFATTLNAAAVGLASALATADETLKQAGADWDTAHTALVEQLRTVIAVLKRTLAPDDARWAAFGLNQPGAKTTPGQPQNVEAHLDTQGRLVVQCEATPLAERYRFRMLRIGVDTEFALAATSKSPMGVISTLLPGQTAEIIVQAVNNGAQGVPSEPILYTMPTLAAAPAKSAPVAEAKASSNGHSAARNGHGNGNGNLSTVTPRMA
jgi:hypothetical protein